MLFAKQSLLSIASVVGKPIAIDKATQEKPRPSKARVKVELDLLDKRPHRVRIHYVDEKLGRLLNDIRRLCMIICLSIVLIVSIKGMGKVAVICCRKRMTVMIMKGLRMMAKLLRNIKVSWGICWMTRRRLLMFLLLLIDVLM